MSNQKQSKKRKYGRNATWCHAYKMRFQRNRNRIAKIRRHIKNFPNDLQAVEALKHD